jgi:hypothetical protein
VESFPFSALTDNIVNTLADDSFSSREAPNIIFNQWMFG